MPIQAPVIELSNVRFSWAAASPVVVDIETLRVANAERIFLHGPSGSGKSTLLGLLAGVVTPREGTLRVLGRDVGALGGAARDRFRADHIGFIFQMFNLIPYLSVVENVCLPCGFSARRRSHATLAGGTVEAEAGRLLDHLEMADADVFRPPVTDLRRGQQQPEAATRAVSCATRSVDGREPDSALHPEPRS